MRPPDEGDDPEPSRPLSGLSGCRRLLRRPYQGDRGLPDHAAGHAGDRHREGTNYNGFDIDETYIAYARRSFGHLGTFHCRYFDAAAAREFAGADLVMMNGVLHHIGDEDLRSTLANIRDVLKDDGVLFTTDPCYRQGQSPIAKWLLDNDRGEFIRDEDGYNKVLGNAFARVKLAIREDLSRLPYTFAIGVMQK
jgi:SAM-dependent methyltransferase